MLISKYLAITLAKVVYMLMLALLLHPYKHTSMLSVAFCTAHHHSAPEQPKLAWLYILSVIS